MTLTNDQKWLIAATLNEKIELWEKCRQEVEQYPRLAHQFGKQIAEAEEIIEKLDEEVEDEK